MRFFFIVLILPSIALAQPSTDKEKKKANYNFDVGLYYDHRIPSISHGSSNKNSFFEQESLNNKGFSIVLNSQIELNNWIMEWSAGYAFKFEKIATHIKYYHKADTYFYFNSFQSSVFTNFMGGYKFSFKKGHAHSLELTVGGSLSYSFAQQHRENRPVESYYSDSKSPNVSSQNHDYSYDINFKRNSSTFNLIGKITYNIPLIENALLLNIILYSRSSLSYLYDFKVYEDNKEIHKNRFKNQDIFTLSIGASYTL